MRRTGAVLVVVAFVVAAGISGGATVAVLSDSKAVTLQISQDNVTAIVGGNATLADNESTAIAGGNATLADNESTADVNTEEELTIDDVDGLIVELEPTERTVETGDQATYEVVVRGATESIASYHMTINASDSSVVAFEPFEHRHGMSITESNITSGEMTISASAGPSDEIIYVPDSGSENGTVLGTVTVNASATGETTFDIDHDTIGIVDGNNTLYNVSVTRGGTLTVTEPNEPPAAENDTYSTSANETLSVAESEGLLANDTDPDGDTLTVAVVDDTSNGELTLEANGSFTYVPRSGFTGEETFTYEVADGDGGTDTATVSIAVEPSE